MGKVFLKLLCFQSLTLLNQFSTQIHQFIFSHACNILFPMKSVSNGAFLKRSHKKHNSHHCHSVRLALQLTGASLLLTPASGMLLNMSDSPPATPLLTTCDTLTSREFPQAAHTRSSILMPVL